MTAADFVSDSDVEVADLYNDYELSSVFNESSTPLTPSGVVNAALAVLWPNVGDEAKDRLRENFEVPGRVFPAPLLEVHRAWCWCDYVAGLPFQIVVASIVRVHDRYTAHLERYKQYSDGTLSSEEYHAAQYKPMRPLVEQKIDAIPSIRDASGFKKYCEQIYSLNVGDAEARAAVRAMWRAANLLDEMAGAADIARGYYGVSDDKIKRLAEASARAASSVLAVAMELDPAQLRYKPYGTTAEDYWQVIWQGFHSITRYHEFEYYVARIRHWAAQLPAGEPLDRSERALNEHVERSDWPPRKGEA